MKALRVLACTIAMLGAAAPAMAADLLFRAEGQPEILSTFDGRPYWEMQAYCAGFHGATANFWAKSGDAAKAKASESAGVAAFTRAVGQIRRDRGVTETAATQLAEGAVRVGGRITTDALKKEGAGPQWNYWRSFCIDADAAYAKAAN